MGTAIYCNPLAEIYITERQLAHQMTNLKPKKVHLRFH